MRHCLVTTGLSIERGSSHLPVEWSEVKVLSRVRLFATPWVAASRASPSMGFSRQEYWSGLPFPGVGWHKWFCVCARSLQSSLTLCDPVDCSPPGSSVHGFSRQQYRTGLPCPSPWDLPHPGIEPTPLISPALTGRFFITSSTWETHKWFQYNALNAVTEMNI